MVERMKWGRQRIVQQLRLSMRTEQQQQTELAQGHTRGSVESGLTGSAGVRLQ